MIKHEDRVNPSFSHQEAASSPLMRHRHQWEKKWLLHSRIWRLSKRPRERLRNRLQPKRLRKKRPRKHKRKRPRKPKRKPIRKRPNKRPNALLRRLKPNVRRRSASRLRQLPPKSVRRLG